MKNIIFLFFSLLCLTASAQQLIDNKGNRNQSYPIITETNPQVVNLINQVNQDSLEARIRYMQQFYRGATSPEALIVQNWLVDNFESYGYDDIEIHYFDYNSQQLDAGNVVVVKKGTEFPDEYIMISSHYDSASPYGSQFDRGADDDASGTSGVMECARLLKDYPTKRSVMFLPFNAEEYDLAGSLPFAQKCASENMNIIAHFAMDMIGWFPPDNPNTTMGVSYSYISKALSEYYLQTANIYIPYIPTKKFTFGDTWGGDHAPFNKYEYPSLYIGDIEYLSKHPCYHKECDTIGPFQVGVNCGVNRLDLVKAFVQAVLASTAELANAWLPPQNLSACSGIDKITVSWDGDNKSKSYKIFKNDTFLQETNEPFYVDNFVEIDSVYEYYVIALNNDGKETAPSNKDRVTFVAPLKLPYFNDFSENRYGFEQSDWVLRDIGDKSSLCNTTGYGSFPDNYLSIAELDWISIPHNTKDFSIRFKWCGTIRGITNIFNYDINNAGFHFEVTNDRKTWHKLAYITGDNDTWEEYEFLLNDYLGGDFFQVRFRLESSGGNNSFYRKIGYITDVEINFEVGIDEPKANPDYIFAFNFSPNPASTYINVETDQQTPYHIAIYDQTGRVVFVQESFHDGQLCVAHLQKGTYFIVASTQQHRVAKKLVIQK